MRTVKRLRALKKIKDGKAIAEEDKQGVGKQGKLKVKDGEGEAVEKVSRVL